MVQPEPYIQKIFTTCASPQKGDSVLVIANDQYRSIATLIYTYARDNNLFPTLIIASENGKKPFIPLKTLKPVIKESDIAFLLFHKQISFFDLPLSAGNSSAKIISMPQVTRGQIERMFRSPRKPYVNRCRKIADILSIGKKAHITTESGTDITVLISRYKGSAVTGATANNEAATSLPFGYCFIQSTGESCSGRIIANGSFTGMGSLQKPVVMHISSGKVKRIYGDTEAKVMRHLLKSGSKPFRDVLGFGVGAHTGAEYRGYPFEDKCVSGAVHLTIGTNKPAVHCFTKMNRFDIVLKDATVCIDGMVLVKNGTLQV